MNPIYSMTQPPNQVKEEKHFCEVEAQRHRQDLRRRLRQERGAIDAETKLQRDLSIAQRLQQLVLEQRPSCLAVYWPIQAEPDLLACFAELHEQGIALALPIVIAKAQPLAFVPWVPGQNMENDAYGIPMPTDREVQVYPDCILAPCVGFTNDRYRLGYGGGFYDRSLAQYPEAFSIGIAYQQSRVSFAPDPYDIPLRAIITESAFYAE